MIAHPDKSRSHIAMKILRLLEKLFTGFFLLVIAISMLTWLGIINPFDTFESAMVGKVENKLRIEASSGNADVQNKLGTLLYTQAKNKNGDFSEALEWFYMATEQQHPIAQTNLAFAYKAGNGVTKDSEKAILFFYQGGINFLKIGFPMDAKDNVYNISRINSNHPLREKLIAAIKAYEEQN